MKETNFKKEIDLYDINDDKALAKTRVINQFIKEYNKGKDLDDQILPSNPYPYRGIIGCLGVQVYAICLGTYKENNGSITLGGYNSYVLDKSKEEPIVVPNLKSLTAFRMIYDMYMHPFSREIRKENKNEKL
jgi:hypothetical protein